jgi:CRP-like cAMP-binding protein
VGQSFGELALQEAGRRRAATVSAAEDCDLLALNGFEYRAVLVEHHRHELDRRVRALLP